jgi:hypothetical protein
MLAALHLAHSEAYKKRKIRSCDMIILRFLCKIFRGFCGSKGTLSDGIDSHKWESKAEIARSLSSKGV